MSDSKPVSKAKFATLISREMIGQDSHLYRFTMPAGEPLGFVGGQYIIVATPIQASSNDLVQWVKHAFSIFSSDSEQREFQLLVKTVYPGVSATYLSQMKLGESLQFTGPWGKFVADPKWPVEGKTWILASDTGITSAAGLVLGSKFKQRLNSTELMWWVENDQYFLPQSLLRLKLPSEFKNCSIYPIRSVRDPGRLTEVLNRISEKISAEDLPLNAFLSGDGVMVRGLRDFLIKKGMKAEHMGTETFFNKENG